MIHRANTLSIIYQELLPVLNRYGLKITGNQSLVEDCIHDVFLKLCEMEDISGIVNMKSYLLRSFKNSLLDKLARLPEDNYDELLHDYQMEQSDEDHLIETESMQKLQAYIENAIESLTNRQKELIYLYYIEQRSYDEICNITGLKYQTARNIVHSALIQLKDQLMKRPVLFSY